MNCTECGQARPPGRALCPDCRNRLRRERYGLDPTYRVAEKARYNTWREEHKLERAEAERHRRHRTKQQEAPLEPDHTDRP